MPQGDGLRPLQVGVAGHDVAGVLLRQGEQRLFQSPQRADGFAAGFLGVQVHVQRHLVVAAAAGVQALAGVADPLSQDGFHQHMDVFAFRRKIDFTVLHVLQDALQPRLDGLLVGSAQDALAAQHPGVGHAAPDVLGKQPLIKGNGRMEIVHHLAGFFLESTAPELHGSSTSVIMLYRPRYQPAMLSFFTKQPCCSARIRYSLSPRRTGSR